MKAVSAQIIATRYRGLDIKINNGIRDFIVNVDKKKLTYEEFKSLQMNVEVYTLLRNCCTAKPIAILKSGDGKDADMEIKELIESIDDLLSEELKSVLG